MNKVDEKLVVKLYRNYGLWQIAKRFKITKEEVKEVLERNGVEVKKPGDNWRNWKM